MILASPLPWSSASFCAKARTFAACLFALGIVSLAVPGAARAQSRPAADNVNVQRARRHFLSGRQAFEARNYAAALREFEAGYAIEPRAGFLLNMGHAARRLGDLPRAHQLYLKFLATDPPQEERLVAEKLVADLERDSPETRPPPSPSPSPGAAPPRLALTASPAPATVAGATSVGTSGAAGASPASPALSLVDIAPPDAATAGASAPIYRRWWFWAGAGGVAAGVVTAILIGTLGSGSGARDSGSLGQIKL